MGKLETTLKYPSQVKSQLKHGASTAKSHTDCKINTADPYALTQEETQTEYTVT